MRVRLQRVVLVAGMTLATLKIWTLEYLLVGMVVLAVALFEVWFFLYSGSPFDQRSGR